MYEILKQVGTYFLKLCAFLILYISPIHSILITVYLLLTFDLISGVSKSYKLSIPITAAGLKLSVIKFVYYSLALIAAYQIDKTMIGADSLFLTKCIAGFINFTELKSLLENVSILTGRNIWNAVKDKIAELFKIKPNV